VQQPVANYRVSTNANSNSKKTNTRTKQKLHRKIDELRLFTSNMNFEKAIS
jgi:hypothetical protein